MLKTSDSLFGQIQFLPKDVYVEPLSCCLGLSYFFVFTVEAADMFNIPRFVREMSKHKK